MPRTFEKMIEAEQAEDVMADMASEGYLPGQRVNRYLLLPVNYSFGLREVVAT